ncbi:major facilitator superfamily domain-containing protein [Mycena galericulata]|nr:major facilitator superfamily domain-containing protein [Mycena galericulata]
MEKNDTSTYDPEPLAHDSGSDSKKEEVDIITSLVQSDADEFPDGGLKAYTVLCGVFQAYYQQELLHHSTPSEIAWIGSIQHYMIFLPAVIVGRLFDTGYCRLLLAGGGLLFIIAAFLVPECKHYWHFMLCQGFGIGIGCGLMFCTLVTAVNHWFKKRRGFALGVATCGGSLGATVVPILIRQLIVRVGLPWAMRIMGFILAFMIAITNVCIARRLSPVRAPGGLFGLHVFRSPAFTVLFISSFIVMELFATGVSVLCGPPISGLFVSTDLEYNAVGYFAGSVILVGADCMFVSRLLAALGLWRKF